MYSDVPLTTSKVEKEKLLRKTANQVRSGLLRPWQRDNEYFLNGHW